MNKTTHLAYQNNLWSVKVKGADILHGNCPVRKAYTRYPMT